MARGDITVHYAEYRPCIVDGRRALFHRWADSARPARPYEQKNDDNSRHYQLWNVQAIVEFEDGTVCRRWPYEIRFLDSADFFMAQPWDELEERA